MRMQAKPLCTCMHACLHAVLLSLSPCMGPLSTRMLLEELSKASPLDQQASLQQMVDDTEPSIRYCTYQVSTLGLIHTHTHTHTLSLSLSHFLSLPPLLGSFSSGGRAPRHRRSASCWSCLAPVARPSSTPSERSWPLWRKRRPPPLLRTRRMELWRWHGPGARLSCGRGESRHACWRCGGR
jgi:hypothetical protein